MNKQYCKEMEGLVNSIIYTAPNDLVNEILKYYDLVCYKNYLPPFYLGFDVLYNNNLIDKGFTYKINYIKEQHKIEYTKTTYDEENYLFNK